MLGMQDMHGYQISELIDSHFGDTVHIKKPTMYDTLKRLAADGLVESHEEQEGNRPLRTVYSMTAAGEREFAELVRASIAEYPQPHVYGDAGLMFVDALEPPEAIELLSERRAAVEQLLSASSEDDPHAGAMDLAAGRLEYHLRAEADWLDDAIRQLQERERSGR
jgi:DNA-binding PadR family transcriptional regulator